MKRNERRRENGVWGEAPEKVFEPWPLFEVKERAKTYTLKLCITLSRQCFNVQRLCSIHGMTAEVISLKVESQRLLKSWQLEFNFKKLARFR